MVIVRMSVVVVSVWFVVVLVWFEMSLSWNGFVVSLGENRICVFILCFFFGFFVVRRNVVIVNFYVEGGLVDVVIDVVDVFVVVEEVVILVF